MRTPVLWTAATLLAGCRTPEYTAAIEASGNYLCLQSNLNRVECSLYEGLEGYPIEEQSSTQYTRLGGERWTMCGLLPDGEADCWGDSGYGRTDPIPKGPFVDLKTGMTTACGIRPDHTAACWGTRVEYLNFFDPAQPWRSLAMGDQSICAIPSDSGTISCWGEDVTEQGALDPPAGDWSEVWGSSGFFAARADDGRFAMWGTNYDGETSPPPDLEFTDLALGFDHACALQPDGTAACWGSDEFGQSDVPEGELFVDIAARGRFTCGLRPDHTVQCWGCFSDALYDEGHDWCRVPVPSWDE